MLLHPPGDRFFGGECSLIVERVPAGMRRARLEGQRIGCAPPVLDDVAYRLSIVARQLRPARRSEPTRPPVPITG